MKDLIKDSLNESIKTLLISKLEMTESVANKFIKRIGFKDYHSLKHMLEAELVSDAVVFLTELDNAYSAAREIQNSTDNKEDDKLNTDPMSANLDTDRAVPNFKKVKIGDKLAIASPTTGHPKPVSVKNKTVAGKTITVTTTDNNTFVQSADKMVPVVPDSNTGDVQGQLDRIKTLAGMQPDSDTKPGQPVTVQKTNEEEVDESSFMSSAAIAGVITPLGEIERRHKKHKKPGPKPKSRNEKAQ